MPGRDEHRDLAPGFEVEIAGSRLGAGLTELVQSLEYESVDGIADEARLTIANPDYALSNSPLWQPGNEMSLWFGYGAELGFVGRVITVKPEPAFMQSALPTITLKGYTKDQLMMQNKPSREKADTRNFEVDSIRDAVERVAARQSPTGESVYAFQHLDIDETPRNRFAAPQKADMSDYNYVKGLANLLGWLFWVDYLEGRGWSLHFKDPENLDVQERKYTFEHNAGDASSLLEFYPELALTGAVTKLQVQSRNPDTGESFVEEFEDTEDAPDAKYTGDPAKTVDEQYTTAGAVVKLFFGDYAVDVVSDKKFQSAADMKIWAQQWWRRKRENFVVGRGKTVGVEDLFARQTHRLVLPVASLTGDYYFPRVRHVFNGTDGYVCDVNARKETPS